MSIGSVIGTPFSFTSAATRHMLDANVTFGQAGDRFNARDDYRREYTGTQRLGAGVGTAFGVALPATAAVAWARKGSRVPGLASLTDTAAASASRLNIPAKLALNTGRVVGYGALAAATGVGVRKSIEIAKDDGDFRALGTATGVVGGAVAGAKVGAGKFTPLVAGAGAVLGGIGGNFAGRQVDAGEGAIGKENVQAPQVDVDAGDRATSFARGAFNHFTEVGPTTQGVSLGYKWGMRSAVQNQYSNSERAGAMHGDLLAAGILGGGALAVATGLMGMSKHAEAGVSGVKAGGDIAGQVLAKSPVMGAMQKLGTKGALGVGAAGAGIAGAVALKEYNAMEDAGGNGALAAGGTLAATAGTAALISRSGAVSGLEAGPKAASSAIVAAALIGVLSSARLPLQQFMNDAKDAHAANGETDWSVSGPSAGIGAAAGGFGAAKGLWKLVPDGGIQLGKFHLSKGLVVGAGTAISAGAMGGVGLGLSSTMPDLKTTGISAAGGAVVGAGLGAAFRGASVKGGGIAGAALGLSASALLNDEKTNATNSDEAIEAGATETAAA